MRIFTSYGPPVKERHYYARREALIDKAVRQLVGENPGEGGRYITVWAPRQCGKTWIMNEVTHRIAHDGRFHVLKLELEHLKMTRDPDRIVSKIGEEIARYLKSSTRFVAPPRKAGLGGPASRPGSRDYESQIVSAENIY